MTLAQFLDDLDRDYDASQKMILRPAHGPGYHTRIVNGTPVHATRETMDYAIALLQSNEAARAGRACDIIDKITTLQVTDPTAQHYGIWGWFLEEPPQQMNPADWNWADFIGSRLAQVLRRHPQQLRPATLAAARIALHHAAMAIFRRNTDPGYTNIAIMGGVVAAAAGELLSMPFLVEYGRVRLGNVLRLVERVGGFSEYNSPTYTRVAIEEAERAIYLVSDATIRGHAEKIRVLAWQGFAEHYHPATGQIAGPCSRAYSDWITPALNRYFTQQTGAAIPLRPAPGRSDDGYDIVPAIACPAELAPRFAALPKDPHEIVTPFADNPRGRIVGTTWFTQEACLGTVNRDTCWNQRRPVLGYWRTPTDPAVCLRVQFLKDGRDYAATYIHQVQKSARVLGSLCLAYDCGPFHPHFDRSPDNIYPMSDLRVRFSLAGNGVEAIDLGAGRFALRAGQWQAILYTPATACTIGKSQIPWRIGRPAADVACVDAVLHEGSEMRLDCRGTALRLGFGLELLRVGENASTQRPAATVQSEDAIRWEWQSLSLVGPEMPMRFRW